MKKIKFVLKNAAILAVLISSFVACDKDFATVGSDIVGQNNFGTDHVEFPVKAYTNVLPPVQTNNLPINFLGAYNDPNYGLTTANFVSQLGISSYSPDFGTGVVLDSVVLTIPYFSKKTNVTADGETVYKLDSIFGSGLINLSIYENNYFLSSINPNSEFQEPLTYYSNMSTSTGPINPMLLEGNGVPLYTVTDFTPDKKEIKLKEDNEIKTRLAPAFRVKLDSLFWKEKIIDVEQGQPQLSNANNFSNYFRGLYFKSTLASGNGNLSLLNFGSSGANITIYYSKDGATEDAERVKSTFVLTFSGNKANFLENEYNFTIPQGDPVNGDANLYLKGGEGATAIIDIFNSGNVEDGNSPEFMQFKNDFVQTDSDGKFIKSKRLVNEANLVFYVDQSMVNGNEPNRIYLYDLKNKKPLLDYIIDAVENTFPEQSRISHLGALKREGNTPLGKGILYKIRITEHINDLLLRDSTNVKLGLAVSTNINLEGVAPQYKVLTTDDALVNTIPVSSILSPKGTVLYGSNTTDEQKKLHLEIYYTEPNN